MKRNIHFFGFFLGQFDVWEKMGIYIMEIKGIYMHTHTHTNRWRYWENKQNVKGGGGMSSPRNTNAIYPVRKKKYFFLFLSIINHWPGTYNWTRSHSLSFIYTIYITLAEKINDSIFGHKIELLWNTMCGSTHKHTYSHTSLYAYLPSYVICVIVAC